MRFREKTEFLFLQNRDLSSIWVVDTPDQTAVGCARHGPMRWAVAFGCTLSKEEIGQMYLCTFATIYLPTAQLPHPHQVGPTRQGRLPHPASQPSPPPPTHTWLQASPIVSLAFSPLSRPFLTSTENPSMCSGALPTPPRPFSLPKCLHHYHAFIVTPTELQRPTTFFSLSASRVWATSCSFISRRM